MSTPETEQGPTEFRSSGGGSTGTNMSTGDTIHVWLRFRAAFCQATQVTMWVLGMRSAADNKYVFLYWWLWFFPKASSGCLGPCLWPSCMLRADKAGPGLGALPSKGVPPLPRASWRSSRVYSSLANLFLSSRSCFISEAGGLRIEPQSWWGDMYFSS